MKWLVHRVAVDFICLVPKSEVPQLEENAIFQICGVPSVTLSPPPLYEYLQGIP